MSEGAEKPSVYLESTIISYAVARMSRDIRLAAQQQESRELWDERRHDFTLYVSEFVVREVSRGDPNEVRKRQELIQSIATLEVTEEAAALAEELVKRGVLPDIAAIDAVHVSRGYECPLICTPTVLLERSP